MCWGSDADAGHFGIVCHRQRHGLIDRGNDIVRAAKAHENAFDHECYPFADDRKLPLRARF